MVNRQRFLLDDLDSEGFPRQDSSPFSTINIGKTPDVGLAQALLADHRCLNCPPSEQCPRSGYCEHRNPAPESRSNPKGWVEVDGVKLPPINWAESISPADQAFVDRHEQLHAQMQGITRLSDMSAPDAYFGWKR